ERAVVPSARVPVTGAMLGMPFRTLPAHVVQFGAIGVARDPHQLLPFGGNAEQGLAEQAQ
ncbi:hypothetical protein, partial [Enterococcus lactis]|uniref:hypothetical protein n=1 Tax=Enterococcus lactis TaxID=357441 RepID=UPI0034E94229